MGEFEEGLWETDRIDHWCPKCQEYYGLEPGEEKVCNREGCGTKLIREYKKHTKKNEAESVIQTKTERIT